MNAQEFRGGLLGGINSSRIDGDGHDLIGKIGLNGGFFVARETVYDNLFWQLEVKYTSRGKYHTIRDVFGNPIGYQQTTLTYLEIPVSMHYNFLERMQAEFGFSPDYLLKESYVDQDGPVPDLNDLRQFGLTAFVGYNYFINEKLAAGFRFNYSVFPFKKFESYAVRYRDSGLFHDVLSVNLKYYIIR